MRIDPTERPTPEELVKHPWLDPKSRWWPFQISFYQGVLELRLGTPSFVPQLGRNVLVSLRWLANVKRAYSRVHEAR